MKGFGIAPILVGITFFAILAVVIVMLPGVRGGIEAAFIILSGQRIYRMSGDSMSPNVNNGEVWNYTEYKGETLQRGNIVIAKVNEKFRTNPQSRKLIIKRVIGVPGDLIAFEGGNVYINGSKLNESSYLPAYVETYGGELLKDGESVTIPTDSYLLLGDNRPQSADSRSMGTFTKDSIFGILTSCAKNC